MSPTISRRAVLKSLAMSAAPTSVLSVTPADADSGGAIEADAPEFIDLLTSENKDYQRILGGGLLWLDSTCSDRYEKLYLDCSAEQQKEILDQIAYRNNAMANPALDPGV